MNIKELQYYLALTELKSFSQVATRFHVSQPTITAAIKRLERELGTQLLIRANPHLPVELTTTGQQVQQHAKKYWRRPNSCVKKSPIRRPTNW